MRNLFLALIIFSAGLLAGWFVQDENMSDRAVTAVEHAATHTTPGYVCPMHSSVVSNEPASCPICGMDLEQKKLSSTASQDSGIQVSAAMTNSLGVRIAHAERGRISEQVFASGNIQTITAAITSSIKTKIEGRVNKVYAKVGDWVAEEEFIVDIASPEFSDLQSRFLTAKKIRDYALIQELHKKLAILEPRKAVLDGIDRINNMELTPEFIVEAPHSGILEWVAKEGDVIAAGDPIARIATKTIARARLRSYSRSARAIKRGRRAQLDLPHMPGLFWPGRVVIVDHDQAGFYSLIQADFEVPDDMAEEGVFVGAYVNAGTNEDGIRIPASSIIRVENESRVVLLRSDGTFEPRVVETGFIGTQWAEIKSGLDEGDAVVTRAQFLIDSESTLRAGFSRLSE